MPENEAIITALETICIEAEKIQYLASTIKNPALKAMLGSSVETLIEAQNFIDLHTSSYLDPARG